MFKFADLTDLRNIRDSLAREVNVGLESERWNNLSSTAKKISEACLSKDLNLLASSVREMKNRLRRPSIRKELARLEGKDDKIPAKQDDEVEGDCQCAECGKTIDGSEDPCIKGALCVQCAYAKKPKNGEEGKDREDKEDRKEEARNRNLRKRGYL
jgi:hypothetical protein